MTNLTRHDNEFLINSCADSGLDDFEQTRRTAASTGFASGGQTSKLGHDDSNKHKYYIETLYTGTRPNAKPETVTR